MANKKINLTEGLKNTMQTVEQTASSVKPTLVSMGMKLEEKNAVKYTRTTIALKEENLDKIKILTVKEKKQLKDIFNEALEEYIAKYEKKNGTVEI